VKKKVAVLILALFMLMPVSGVFASTENILLNIPTDDGSTNLTDGNLETYELIGGSISPVYRFTLPEEFYVTAGEVRSNDGSYFAAADQFTFYDRDMEIIYKGRIQPSQNLDLKVKYIDYTYPIKNLGPWKIGEIILYGSLDGVPPGEIKNINYYITDKTVNFEFDLPTDEDFSHVKIYQDDVLIADNVTDTSYTFENLDYGGTYNFKFTTVDETGNESEGVVETVTIATPELEEIKEVNAEPSHDRIDLSWALPETEYLEHVNIYRKSVSDVQTFSLLSTDDYDPLFETNGTYFNDLTVEEQTTYDYKLTTEFQGLESEGVNVQATTLAAPPPELSGQEFEEQENGDYLVTWQQPETGQVRILVDGQEYVVVPATDKQYTIPAADMKYSALGDPLVGLQTIGDNGEESEVEQQESNVNLPFGINELLTTSAGLMRVIGSLILLGLSFILVPKFIKVIKQSLSNKKNAETERTEREKRVSERAYKEPRESRISTREVRTSTRVPREYRKGE